MIAETRAECVRRLKDYSDAEAFGGLLSVMPQRAMTPPFTYLDLFGTRDQEAAMKDETYVVRVTTVQTDNFAFQTNPEIEAMDPLLSHHRQAMEGVARGFSFIPAGEFTVDRDRLQDVTRAQVGPNAGQIVVAQSSFRIVEHAS